MVTACMQVVGVASATLVITIHHPTASTKGWALDGVVEGERLNGGVKVERGSGLRGSW